MNVRKLYMDIVDMDKQPTSMEKLITANVIGVFSCALSSSKILHFC